MLKRRSILCAMLLLVGLLAACSGNPSAPTLTPQPPAATPTAAITPTAGPITWGGDSGTVQPDLIATITSSPVQLEVVSGLALDQEGDLYVVDQGNSRILKFDDTGKFVMQWGGKGAGNGQFDMSGDPKGNETGLVAIAPQGNVYVTDKAHVQKFDGQGKFLAKWAVQGTSDGVYPLAGAIAIDSQNDVYVVNMDNNNVQKFDANGKFLLKWGEQGDGQGQFGTPNSVAVDTQGNILVADAFTKRLQKFDSNGKFLSQVYLGAVDGLVVSPASLLVTDQGQIYVGEFGNQRVVEFDKSGKVLMAWGNTGAYADQLSEVWSMAIDKDGALYVADLENHRVLKYQQH